MTTPSKTANFTFLTKIYPKRYLTISGLTFFHKIDKKKVWKSGKQCVIFAAALQERPRGLEVNSRAIWIEKQPFENGLKKKMKNNFGRENN